MIHPRSQGRGLLFGSGAVRRCSPGPSAESRPGRGPEKNRRNLKKVLDGGAEEQ